MFICINIENNKKNNIYFFVFLLKFKFKKDISIERPCSISFHLVEQSYVLFASTRDFNFFLFRRGWFLCLFQFNFLLS